MSKTERVRVRGVFSLHFRLVIPGGKMRIEPTGTAMVRGEVPPNEVRQGERGRNAEAQ